MITLCLDTTTHKLMLALGQEKTLLAQANLVCDSHRYHSALLIPEIQNMLKQAGLSVKDVSALAVNQGPGSFTGLRTGIITARTMAQFLQLPVYTFNHFELLAFGVSKPIAIYLDALRGRAYHAILQFEAAGVRYLRPPALTLLETTPIPEGFDGDVLVSPSLSEMFAPDSTRLITEHFFSPVSMLGLIDTYGNYYRKPWQAVRPFYLQEPSITLKKQKTLE